MPADVGRRRDHGQRPARRARRLTSAPVSTPSSAAAAPTWTNSSDGSPGQRPHRRPSAPSPSPSAAPHALGRTAAWPRRAAPRRAARSARPSRCPGGGTGRRPSDGLLGQLRRLRATSSLTNWQARSPGWLNIEQNWRLVHRFRLGHSQGAGSSSDAPPPAPRHEPP